MGQVGIHLGPPGPMNHKRYFVGPILRTENPQDSVAHKGTQYFRSALSDSRNSWYPRRLPYLERLVASRTQAFHSNLSISLSFSRAQLAPCPPLSSSVLAFLWRLVPHGTPLLNTRIWVYQDELALHMRCTLHILLQWFCTCGYYGSSFSILLHPPFATLCFFLQLQPPLFLLLLCISFSFLSPLFFEFAPFLSPSPASIHASLPLYSPSRFYIRLCMRAPHAIAGWPHTNSRTHTLSWPHALPARRLLHYHKCCGDCTLHHVLGSSMRLRPQNSNCCTSFVMRLSNLAPYSSCFIAAVFHRSLATTSATCSQSVHMIS